MEAQLSQQRGFQIEHPKGEQARVSTSIKQVTFIHCFHPLPPSTRMLAKSIGLLYVGGHPHPLSEIKLNSVLRELNNKIIECKWDAEKNGWSFMRERTDKSFPNAYSTAMGKPTFNSILKATNRINFRRDQKYSRTSHRRHATPLHRLNPK